MRVLTYEQGSPEWHAARVGVITGSQVKKVYGREANGFLYELIASTLVPAQESWVSEDMERGTELEPDARMLYESMTGYSLDQVGLCLHDEYDWLGVSPDGLYKEKKKYVGAIEIKCPSTKVHIEYLVEKCIPTEYKAQVLHYFIVNPDLEWLDFISYDPRIQLPDLQISIVRVTRDELTEEIDSATKKLLAFRQKWEALQDQLIF